MKDDHDSQNSRVLEKWERDMEKNRAKAGAFKKALKEVLAEQMRSEGQKAALGKEIISASQNPSPRLPKREGGWDLNEAPDTGMEPRLWERE